MHIDRVRRWVGASLVFFTLEHFAAGMVIFASFMDEPSQRDNQIGLVVMSGVMGLGAVVVALVILQRRVLSPLLALALVWPLVGWYFVL
jgi:hypothetical protein